MTVDYEEIGKNIKLYRIRRELKQAQLAERVGVSSQHISHIECGRTKLGMSLLIQISEVLSVDLYTLLGSNVQSRPDISFNIELANLLKDATTEQQSLCLAVCRTIIGFGDHI